MGSRKTLIINYGVGNHQSVANALKFLGYDFMLSGDKGAIRQADVYILPGVGAFGEAMNNLKRLDLIDTLSHDVLENKKPILGICLGMQILAESSEEDGHHEGLGWIKGSVRKLSVPQQYRVPQVGWNNLRVLKKDPLFAKTEPEANFYFDHSYAFNCEDTFVAATCQYGKDVVAAVQKDNIFGVQFHPEKSQKNGLKLFRSFFNYVDSCWRSDKC